MQYSWNLRLCIFIYKSKSCIISRNSNQMKTPSRQIYHRKSMFLSQHLTMVRTPPDPCHLVNHACLEHCCLIWAKPCERLWLQLNGIVNSRPMFELPYFTYWSREVQMKLPRETKHWLAVEISVLEMSVNEEFEEWKSIFSTERFPNMKPYTEQWSPQRTKKQEMKNSDFTMMVIKQQNRLHRKIVESPSLMIFKGWPCHSKVGWGSQPRDVQTSLPASIILWFCETRTDITGITKLRFLLLIFYLVPKSKDMGWDTRRCTPNPTPPHHRYSAEGRDCDGLVANETFGLT